MYIVGLYCLGHYLRVVTTLGAVGAQLHCVGLLAGEFLYWTASCQVATTHIFISLSPFFFVVVLRSLVRWLLVGPADAMCPLLTAPHPWALSRCVWWFRPSGLCGCHTLTVCSVLLCYEGHGWSWGGKVLVFWPLNSTRCLHLIECEEKKTSCV